MPQFLINSQEFVSIKSKTFREAVRFTYCFIVVGNKVPGG